MINILSSPQINDFFNDVSDEDGFWDALREDRQMKPDYEWWVEDDYSDHFEEGAALAAKAAAAGTSIYCYSSGGTNKFYWAGTEEEIVRKLKSGWESWQERYPLESEEEITARKREERRQKIQQQLRNLNSELEDLQID